MSQTNGDLVRETYEKFNRGDIPAVLATFADDIEWHEPDWVIERGGTFHSSQDVLHNVFETVPRNWDSLRLVPSEILEAGDVVISRGKFVGRPKGSAQEIEVPFVHLFTIRDGKVVTGDAYIDVKELTRLDKTLRRVA